MQLYSNWFRCGLMEVHQRVWIVFTHYCRADGLSMTWWILRGAGYRVSPEIPVSSNYRFSVSSTAMVCQSAFGEMLILFKQCRYWQKNHRQLKIQWKIWSLECLLPHNSILLFCDSSHFGTQHLTYCFIATFCARRAAHTPLLLSVQAWWARRTRQSIAFL